jgi:hypothetical protein
MVGKSLAVTGALAAGVVVGVKGGPDAVGARAGSTVAAAIRPALTVAALTVAFKAAPLYCVANVAALPSAAAKLPVETRSATAFMLSSMLVLWTYSKACSLNQKVRIARRMSPATLWEAYLQMKRVSAISHSTQHAHRAPSQFERRG